MTSGYERIADYTVVKRLGSGRFGEVFLVRHKHTGKFYCWKVVPYKGLNDKEKQQLVMEVNVIRELNHPNIVRYIDRMIDKKRQLLYILMEYCDSGDLGENMRQFYKHYKLVNEQVIFDIALQLIFALAYCHNCKIGTKTGKVLHRDLKPQNIVLSTKQNKDGNKSYVCKIGDFGLCRQIGMSSFANSCVGTPYYWCPELLLSSTKNYDDKMDMWALGCVLYELSTGKTPFHYTTTLAELTREMKMGVPLPLEYRSQKLNTLLSCLLQRDPNKRASAMECLGYTFWAEPATELFLGTLNKADYDCFMKHRASQKDRMEEIERNSSKDWYTLLMNAGKKGDKREEIAKYKSSNSIQSLVNLSNFQDVYGSEESKREPKYNARYHNTTSNINILEYVKHFQDSIEMGRPYGMKSKEQRNEKRPQSSWDTPQKKEKMKHNASSVETRFSRMDSDLSDGSVTTKVSKYERCYLEEYGRREMEEYDFKIQTRTSHPSTYQ
ncbi:protein kinase [Theileria orientalis]|uniref:non-specific serine/threonine protein kinase n=1 Tax=Theileria orientalis TaxID=68886 RepID=A0A976QR91_THEOR|nr:protein kinase [Theileria orientalis]